MSQAQQVAEHPGGRSVLRDMATRFGMESAAFEQTLRNTVVPGNATREQFAAFLLVAKKYNLDPITKQIYAFPSKGGGIQPIVSIDGWMALINSHDDFDGMEFEDHLVDAKIVSITCRMYRKSRSHPVSVTEYMDECRRSTEPWKQWPARMLRHKAAIQAARYAFGFAGIVDPDEADRIQDVTPAPAAPARAERETYSEERFAELLPRWRDLIQSGRKSAAEIIAMVSSKADLTDEQADEIRACEAIEAEPAEQTADDEWLADYNAAEEGTA